MQRTFSSFPSGIAGIALLVLRVVVGALASLEAGLLLAVGHTVLMGITWAAIIAMISGLVLMVGFLTPVASALISLQSAVITVMGVPPAAFPLIDSRMAAFELGVMAVVLVLLGPGAISLDARLFGRREVAISEVPHRWLNSS